MAHKIISEWEDNKWTADKNITVWSKALRQKSVSEHSNATETLNTGKTPSTDGIPLDL